MRVAHLTAGAGGFFCGTCIRDNALVRGLRVLGEQAELVPLYLPILSEGASCSDERPILMSGINVYLQQTVPLSRVVPRWMDAPLAARPLLALAGGQAGRTRPEDVGELTLSMLAGLQGNQRKEVLRLVDHVAALRPDVVVLSNSLLVGLAPALREGLGVPVVCTVQGELHFVDAMGAWREPVWRALSDGLGRADGIVAVSAFAADAMAARTGLRRERFSVVHNGIDVTGYRPREVDPEPPVLGFLARLIPAKGIEVIIGVFAALKERHPTLRLAMAGTLNGGDRPALDAALHGVEGVMVEPHISSERKRSFLAGLTVLCVPAQKDDTFGTYNVEAMAAGVPVVAPRRGAITEVVEAAGGGVLVPAGDEAALVEAIDGLLRDPVGRRRLGEGGRAGVAERFTEARMAEGVREVLRGVVGR